MSDLTERARAVVMRIMRDAHPDIHDPMVWTVPPGISEGELQAIILQALLGATHDLQQQLAASQARVRELEMKPPKECHQSDLTCGHNSYWRTVYDTCMACRAEQAEQERDRLRAALEQIARWFGEFPASGKNL